MHGRRFREADARGRPAGSGPGRVGPAGRQVRAGRGELAGLVALDDRSSNLVVLGDLGADVVPVTEARLQSRDGAGVRVAATAGTVLRLFQAPRPR